MITAGGRQAEVDQASATPAFEIPSLQQNAEVISNTCNPDESLLPLKWEF